MSARAPRGTTTRRRLLGAALAAPVAASIAAAGAATAPSSRATLAATRGAPRNYVLVHGTGHGGWCWTHVAARLRAAGHRVFTPTLTGLGERSHLLSPQIGLDTHITDVVNVAEWEELSRFVIVGHSYAGYVITGVCDRMRDRIEHAFYIDAASPKDGDTNGGFRSIAEIERAMGPLLDGAYLPVKAEGLAGLGVSPEDKENTAWLMRRLTPHPVKTWIDPIHLEHGGSTGLPRTYVFCNKASATSPLRRYADLRRVDPSFRFRELPCGHDAMVVLPDETANVLLDL